jgi:hypothetical protein
VTDPMPGHTEFDELAAGYAVHALDPAEELRFLRHAGQCDRCQRALDDYAGVAAAMADLAPAAEPSPQLAERIMAMATGDLAADNQRAAAPPVAADPVAAGPATAGDRAGERPPARVLPFRRRSRLVTVAAAAAAAVVIAGGVWGGLAATRGSGPVPVADCVQAHQCTEVVLTASATHRTAAKVIVRDGVVYMEPAAMTANPTDEIYVLWQITGARIPLPVGSFDIRAGAHGPVRIGGLAAPYRSTWAFAVSLEHGRIIPPKPSNPIALGQVSA